MHTAPTHLFPRAKVLKETCTHYISTKPESQDRRPLRVRTRAANNECGLEKNVGVKNQERKNKFCSPATDTRVAKVRRQEWFP